MMNSATLLKEMPVLQNAVNSYKDILYSIQAPLCSFCDIYLTPLKLRQTWHDSKPNRRNVIVATGHFTLSHHSVDGFRLLCSNWKRTLTANSMWICIPRAGVITCKQRG